MLYFHSSDGGQWLPRAELQSLVMPDLIGHLPRSFRPLLSYPASSLRDNLSTTDDYPLPLSEGGQVRPGQPLHRQSKGLLVLSQGLNDLFLFLSTGSA